MRQTIEAWGMGKFTHVPNMLQNNAGTPRVFCICFAFCFPGFGFAVSWPRVVSYLALFACPLQNSLLDGALANESVNGHLFRLAQTMRSIHGLLVDSGIPIRIVEDYLQVLKVEDM